MPTNTTYAQLYLYNNTTDKEVLFSEFRERIAGTADTSNMQKIDKLLSRDNDRINKLEDSVPILTAKATTDDTGNNFVANIDGFTEYKQDLIMAVYLSQNNVGLTTININNLGIKSLMKFNSEGSVINLEENDLKKNVGYLFQYDGTQFVLLQEKTFQSLYKEFLTFKEIEGNPYPPLPLDSDLLGGIPAEEYLKKVDNLNGNILVNPRFQYNGRNQNSYSGSIWTVDGWYSTSGSATISLPNGVSILSCGNISQFIKNSPSIFGETVTFSVKDSSGTIYTVTTQMPEISQAQDSSIASQTTTWGSIALWNSSQISDFSVVIVVESSAELVAAKLEVGAVSTLETEINDPTLEDLEQLRLDLYDLDPGRPAYILTQNENLLDNWYFVGGGSQQGGGQFPINQRGQTSYSGARYGIDRWTSSFSSTNLFIGQTGIVFSNSENVGLDFLQYVSDWQNFSEKTITLSFLTREYGLATLSGSVQGDSGFLKSGYPGISTLLVGRGEANNSLYVRIGASTIPQNSSFTLIAAKLELGFRSTLARLVDGEWVLNDAPPNFQQELAKCQRELSLIPQEFKTRMTDYNSNQIRFSVYTPVKMRTAPTLINSQYLFVRDIQGYPVDGFSFSLGPYTGLTTNVIATKNAHGMTDAELYVTNGPAFLSSEL